jgi:putative hemolysin
MQAMYWEILLIVILILVTGLLAMSEFAIGSASRTRLREWASKGDQAAKAALELSEDPRRLRRTLHAGMILSGSLAAVIGGSALVPRLSQAAQKIDFLAPYHELVAVAGVGLALAIASLVLIELVPRRIAHGRPERIARVVSRPVQAMAFLAAPIVGALGALTDLLLRTVGLRPVHEPPVTQEKISGLLQEATKSGVLEAGEHEMIQRVFRFSDRRARALMTPRNEIVWIDVADPPDEIRRKMIASHHTRFPVCDQSLDNLLGIVHMKDLLVQHQGIESFRITGRLTMPLFIYEGTRGLKILEMFKKSTTRVAVVLDEYGTVEGLLTLTDILEAIVGDMPLTPEVEEPAAVERSDGSWLLDGRMPLDEFRELFRLSATPEGDFHTLAGFVVTQLGHIPRISESFDAVGLHFEIVDMDGNRVDRILVKENGDS